jgi:hypothetical protein
MKNKLTATPIAATTNTAASTARHRAKHRRVHRLIVTSPRVSADPGEAGGTPTSPEDGVSVPSIGFSVVSGDDA